MLITESSSEPLISAIRFVFSHSPFLLPVTFDVTVYFVTPSSDRYFMIPLELSLKRESTVFAEFPVVYSSMTASYVASKATGNATILTVFNVLISLYILNN